MQSTPRAATFTSKRDQSQKEKNVSLDFFLELFQKRS
jgi:hypothetical protein